MKITIDFNNTQINEALNNLKGKAIDVLNSKECENVLTEMTNLFKNTPVLNSFVIIPQFISIIRDYCRGEYTLISRTQILLILAGVIYTITPVDMIPDVGPLGYLDDIQVLKYVVSRTTEEIAKYNLWKEAHTNESQNEELAEVA